jgi:hypothetical protein
MLGAAVAGLVAYAILWLPPDDVVAEDIKLAVVGYETASEIAWPKSATPGLPFTPGQEERLIEASRAALAQCCAGEALDVFDARRAVETFLHAYEWHGDSVVVKWKGEVVYFDFVRHTPPSGAIVRAGVLKGRMVGRVDVDRRELFMRRWLWAEGVDIKEYRLREIDGVWKVSAVEHWGVCEPDGENVIEGKPSP